MFPPESEDMSSAAITPAVDIDNLPNESSESMPSESESIKSDRHEMLSLLESKLDADIRFIAKEGYNIWAHQNVLKNKSKKLLEWCTGYIPSTIRFIIVSNVSKESVAEFLKLAYTDDLEVNENLAPDILMEVLYLFEKFLAMDKFFCLQHLYLDYLKKTLTSIYAVIVFVKAREFHLKDAEQVAWGFICGFVKKVVMFDFTMNNENMTNFLTKEGMTVDMAVHFDPLLRFAQPVVMISDSFCKSIEFNCSITLISFIQRLKWSITEFGDAACFGPENIIKYLNADSFYNFSNGVFFEEDIHVPEGDNSCVTLASGIQVPKKNKSSGQSSFATSLRRIRPEGYNEQSNKMEREYYVRRLFSCTDFIFANLGHAESLSFVSDTAIKLVKLGLYGCQDVPSYIDQYFVRVTIVDPKKNVIVGQTVQLIHNTGPKFYIKLATPVMIKPHKKYTIVTRIKGPQSCIGIKKKSMIKIKCYNTVVTLYFPPDEEDQGMRIPDIVFVL